MSLVLTERSSIACANQGTVHPIATQSKLKIAGARVLIDGDLAHAQISLCNTVPDPNTGTKRCFTVASASGGVSHKLKVAGKGVLLETIGGQTDGVVPASGGIQTWSVKNAGQSKLKAP
jgi:hypothetical protein